MKYLIIAVLCLTFGWGIGKTYYSRIIEKPVEIVKEVKVYDFTQEPEIINAYLGLKNKVIVDKTELDKKWAEGYSEGIRACARKAY